MLNTSFMFAGGGLALVILYVLVSNTLWLLFGSRLLQIIPGINIKGYAGTVKIAAMLILLVTGSLTWLLKYTGSSLIRKETRPVFKDEVSKMLWLGGRITSKKR